MSAAPHSTLLDTLTAVQAEVLQALVEGLSITAAAERGGVHRSTVHLWTRDHPTFARALLIARQDRADRITDELGDLHQLAIDTFRQILSDPQAPAATRLKAAMEIVKLVQNQRPTQLAQLKSDLQRDQVFADLTLAETANQAAAAAAPAPAPHEPIAIPDSHSQPRPNQPIRNAPCPCGSRIKYKRCCGNPVARAA